MAAEDGPEDGPGAMVEELLACSRPVLLERLAGERDLLWKRRSSATAAVVLLQEGRFPSFQGHRLKEQALLLIGGIDERLGWLAGIGAELEAACKLEGL